MSEEVERVARALCLANGTDPDWVGSAWMAYRASARAAIAAMEKFDRGNAQDPRLQPLKALSWYRPKGPVDYIVRIE